MTLRAVFASGEDMDRLLDLRLEEGLRTAVGQIDALLAG